MLYVMSSHENILNIVILKIRASPQARVYFEKVCVEEGLRKLKLIRWVRTRWGLMHDLVSRVLETKPVFSKYLY
jgi:hypothetical protein